MENIFLLYNDLHNSLHFASWLAKSKMFTIWTFCRKRNVPDLEIHMLMTHYHNDL